MTMTLEHISRDLRAYSAQSGTSLDRGECAEIADAIDGAIRERDELRKDVGALNAQMAEAEAGDVQVQLDIENANLRAAQAQAELAAIKSATCAWTHDLDEDTWDSACGERWMFYDGGPRENNVRFCHGCGKRVLPVQADE